jgi:hypothetical protein
MRTYDPSQAPNPQEWSALTEDRKLHLVRRYHKQEDELPAEVDEELHAVCHMTIENQVALGDETPVAATLDRLVDEGLTRHGAIHAIAGVLMEHIWEQQRAFEEGQTPEDSTFSEDYFEAVQNLTAQQWRDRAPKL